MLDIAGAAEKNIDPTAGNSSPLQSLQKNGRKAGSAAAGPVEHF